MIESEGIKVLIVLEQLFQLFIFIIVGYILGKTGLIKAEHSKALSTVCVYIFFPCNNFKAFSKNFNVGYLSEYYPLILISAAILVFIILFSHFASGFFSKEDYEKKVYKYSLVVPNYGYMGYALAESLFGEKGLLNIIFFAIPITLYIYTYAFSMLTKREVSFKKIFNPGIVGILIGAFFGLPEINIPTLISSTVSRAASCMAPVSMILAGLTISEFKIKDMICDKKAYFMTALRLLVIPLAILFILKPWCSPEIVSTAVLLYAMPCGMNTILFPKLVDEDCKPGARLAFVSNVLCIATIPVILSLI